MKSMNKSSYNSSGSGAKPSLGVKSMASGLARPGQRQAKGATADSVSSANGKVARPGFSQEAPKSAAGYGTIARPGGFQTIDKGVNTKGMKRGKTTSG